MWFKNLIAYRLTKPVDFDSEQLNQQLQDHLFTPCSKQQASTYGWVPPLGSHSDLFLHQANDLILICAKREDKILPASVIKDFVQDKVTEIEESQFRKVTRKEREQIKEDTIQALLPKAFSRSQKTFACLAPQQGWLLVDAASHKKAEELTSFLRQSIGSLPVVPLMPNDAPNTIMTSWLNGNALPTPFIISDECELREPTEDGSIIRCKRQDLLNDEICTLINNGKQVSKLALQLEAELAFVLADDFTLKRLKFADELIEQASIDDPDDKAVQFDADFILMTNTLLALIEKLGEQFGGFSKGE
ncbi:recombination-associated protein RdgC [Zooshikella ganghwensis]|uniref:Recombination-associated protein RdgC n=1 Tax=Zooshikella ganghwensis TaxID=202772 RepID=A0A4P9VK87_9GAMM|nr:recombination-associated protein RdgC [Zooshikella ganghwensis]RDH43116.1 recombination-associated protein RdgC [Zooshikella ganghwensis]